MNTNVYVVTVYTPRDYHPDEIKERKAFSSHEKAIQYVTSSEFNIRWPTYSIPDGVETQVIIDELELE